MFFDFSTKSTLEIKETFKKTGCVFFEGNYDLEKFNLFASEFGDSFIHRDSSNYGVTIVKNNAENKDGFYGLSNKELFPHTDRSSELKAPNIVFLYCKENSGVGGDSLLIDTKSILLDIISIYGKNNIFTDYGNAIFSNSQFSFMGNIFNTLDDGSYFLRFRNDKFGYFNTELNKELNIFYDLIEKHKVSFKMKENQGYMINNARFLHGRTEFRGSREMWRILSYDNFLETKGFTL